ncbi:hypothetical protein E2C01_080377 [Portunus trituberculatus]|uniref:Uncharacterized protein n=1 Tax=Portunus trituberculatus TaxID=210409 RepID=A0A5B7IV97_PORTR|nr:hypothetical protein [Portunus trituberculatus]
MVQKILRKAETQSDRSAPPGGRRTTVADHLVGRGAQGEAAGPRWLGRRFNIDGLSSGGSHSAPLSRGHGRPHWPGVRHATRRQHATSPHRIQLLNTSSRVFTYICNSGLW